MREIELAITPEMLVDAGYERFDDGYGELTVTNYIESFRKDIRNEDGFLKYRIVLRGFDGTRTIGELFLPYVVFEKEGFVAFNVEPQIGPYETIEQVEEFYEMVWEKMECSLILEE